ncbi:hypothetical protein D3C84_729050 [compost metagenome]
MLAAEQLAPGRFRPALLYLRQITAAEAIDHLARFPLAALFHQPQRRLRGALTHQQHQQRRHRTAEQNPAPGIVAHGLHQVADDVGHGETEGPGHGHQRQQRPAETSRHQFCDQRYTDNEIRPQGKPEQQA